MTAIADGSAAAQDPATVRGAVRLDAGRFTVVAYPPDVALARTLLARAQAHDTFPGLPRPKEHVLLALAPDAARFREWVGPEAPEWGAAIAIPDERRIVMHGRDTGSDAGDPVAVLRHELAHLALHEFMGELPPRWFDEGYAGFAAGEWGRDESLATNVALLLHGTPSLDSLDAGFAGGARAAEQSYALAFRAVSDLASLDRERGLTVFLRTWRETSRFDPAVRAAYGMTGDAFERFWQTRTRRRYGVLALFANLSLATSVFLIAFMPLWVARRRRDRRRLAAMREADAAAEREERQSVMSALLDELD